MRKKILICSFFLIFLASQLSFINSKNLTFLTKAIENPYIPYSNDSNWTTFSGKSLDVVDDNNNHAYANGSGTGISYFQVIDNSTNDYFNYATNLASNSPIMTYRMYQGESYYQKYSVYFYPSLSNIKNNNTYYASFTTNNNVKLINEIWNFGYSIGSPTSEIRNDGISWNEINIDETESRLNHYAPTDIYPYINPYSSDNNDVFKINNVSSNGELTFTIKINNWTESTDIDYLTKEENIGVTLINEDETDEYLKYEQYKASLISNNGNYYTYQITGFTPETNYSFYSINFTGLTIGNSVYYPDFDIRLADELGVPKNYTTIYQVPYIDPNSTDVFTIKNVDAKSIEFSLKIIDSYDNYLNHLKTEDNTIDITLKNVDSGQSVITEAVFKEENNDTFTFKISGLDNKTNYQFTSLDNTGLMINGVVDPIISFEEDLEIYDAFFTTGSNLFFYLIIGISILLIIILLIIIIILFIKKRNKKIDKVMSSSFQ